MRLQRLLPLIGIVIFLYILWNMDPQKVFASMRSIDPLLFSLTALLLVPIILLKAIKWNILARSCRIDQPFRDSVSGWLVGFAIGTVTPGRIGDLSRAYYLREDSGLGTGLTSVVIDRLTDVVILFVLTIAGLSILFTSYTIGNVLIPIVIIFLVLITGLAAFTKKGIVAFILKPFFRRFVPDRYKPKLDALFRGFYKGIGLMGGRKCLVALSIFVCIAIWAISIFQYYLLSLSLGLGVSYPFLFMTAPLTILLDALPISFSGLGTRDAVFIYFFGLVGIAAEPAVAFSIMILLVNYVIVGIVGMVLWVKNPLNIGGGDTQQHPRPWHPST